MIATNDLSVVLSGRSVLQNISVNFVPGTFHVLCGPNGSGKTTLLRHLSGLQAPTAGSILFGDTNIASLPPKERQRLIAWVPAEHPMTFDYTAADVIEWGRRCENPGHRTVLSQWRQRKEDVIEILRLGPFLSKPMTRLSLGEQKRVHLARALASQSTYIFLDEPCAPLDPSATLDLMALVKEATLRDQRTVVSSLHDLNTVLNHAGCVTVLDMGRVALQGASEAVLTSQAIQQVLGVQLILCSTGGGKASFLKRTKAQTDPA